MIFALVTSIACVYASLTEPLPNCNATSVTRFTTLIQVYSQSDDGSSAEGYAEGLALQRKVDSADIKAIRVKLGLMLVNAKALQERGPWYKEHLVPPYPKYLLTNDAMTVFKMHSGPIDLKSLHMYNKDLCKLWKLRMDLAKIQKMRESIRR